MRDGVRESEGGKRGEERGRPIDSHVTGEFCCHCSAEVEGFFGDLKEKRGGEERGGELETRV